ncbi:MAG: hypothetical protein LKE47_05600 [Prevotella sp.]|jgi:hypothetical protein|nr:hypothetical protein [Prevotella sp.]MCH3969872.1 hypothetical protein [Prevotella sp.]MCI2086988.1 hypothetical protein [Prevotella sp.]MCI2125652.1 hypothetical protein [Prevotella sp.]
MMEKMKYEAPRVECLKVDVESLMASTSVTAKPGSNNNTGGSSPGDWTENNDNSGSDTWGNTTSNP